MKKTIFALLAVAARGGVSGSASAVDSASTVTVRVAWSCGECRKQGATLVIAKLDRLARNVHFVSGLMESNGQTLATFAGAETFSAPQLARESFVAATAV